MRGQPSLREQSRGHPRKGGGENGADFLAGVTPRIQTPRASFCKLQGGVSPEQRTEREHRLSLRALPVACIDWLPDHPTPPPRPRARGLNIS